jgi:hypothetical protein
MSFVYLSITKLFDKINNSIYTTIAPAILESHGVITSSLESNSVRSRATFAPTVPINDLEPPWTFLARSRRRSVD